MNIFKEKKILFRNAVRYADKADDNISELYALSDLRKTLTDKQIEAIREYKEAFHKLKAVAQELESGRSE